MRKNKNLKVASAKDIYNYLKQHSDENNTVQITKRDVAKHFGYKSSNGDGFLANFKYLEDTKLIENISMMQEI